MSSNRQRRRSVVVIPIESEHESERIESTALHHLSRRTSFNRDRGANTAMTPFSPMVISPIYQPDVQLAQLYQKPGFLRAQSSAAIYISDQSTFAANDDKKSDAEHQYDDYHNKVHCLQGHRDSVLCLATWNKYIFSGSQDSTIGVWNTDTFLLEGRLLGHSRSILGLYVMNDSCLVSTSRDNCICLWDIASLSLLFRFTGLPSLVYDIECISFPNNGGYYLYGCNQGTNIFVISLSILPYLMQLYYENLKVEQHEKEQMAAFNKKSKKKKSKRKNINMENKCKAKKEERSLNLSDLKGLLLLNNPCILCPEKFNGPWLHDENEGIITQQQEEEDDNNDNNDASESVSLASMISTCVNFQLPPDTSKIRELISNDAKVQFLSKSIDEIIDIYYELVYDDDDDDDNEEEPFMIHRLFGGCHRGFIYVMKQIENESILITAASDGTCKIWDISNKYKLKLLSVLTGHTHSVIDCALVEHNYLITASRDKTIKVWNIANIHKPHARTTINGDDSELTAIKVIGCELKACVIVSATRNNSVTFWNAKSYDLIASYRVNADICDICVMRFEFIKPSWLLLCDTANTVQIWNVEEILRSQITHTIDATPHSIDTILTHLGLTEYKARFKAEKVDYNTLLVLKESDLIQIQIPLGPRKKICNFIQDMKANRHQSILRMNRNDSMIADLAQFISFKSISCRNENKSDCWNAAYFFQSLSEQFGAETRLVQGNADKNPVVLARFASNNNIINAQDTTRIIMYGHYDVVDIHNEQGWKSAPFELTGRNGYLYGRGSTDNKGPIIVFLYAIRELLSLLQQQDKEEIDVEIIMIIEGHEEYEWKKGGLTHVVEQNMDWLSSAAVIVCSNSYWLCDKVPCLVYGMRGHLQLNIDVKGLKQDCHSGVHGGAFNEPMFDLISVLSKLKENNKILVPGFYDHMLKITKHEEKLYEEIMSTFNTENYLKSIGFVMDNAQKTKWIKMKSDTLLMQKWHNPSLSVHNVQQSSNGCSVISKHASAIISVRTVPNQNNIDIISKCKKYLSSQFNKLDTFNKMTITANNIGYHWRMDCNNFIFKCAHKAIVKHWGITPYYVMEGGTIPSTNYLHNKLKAPILQFPLGQSTDRAHLENERIRLQNLLKGKDVIQSFLFNLIQHQQQ